MVDVVVPAKDMIVIGAVHAVVNCNHLRKISKKNSLNYLGL